jgi:hypothetical protein
MGWLPQECLNMPARMFFAMLSESRKQEILSHNAKMVDLVDIQAISVCTIEYQKELRGVFEARKRGGTFHRGAIKKVDHKDPEGPAWLSSVLQQKGRLEGLHG